MVQVTEVTGIEQVRDDDENLLYIEYLVAVFDRDYRDPSSAKCIGTEKIRVTDGVAPGQLIVQYVDPVTETEVASVISSAQNMDELITTAKDVTRNRINAAEVNRKWRAEPLFR